MAWTYTQNFDSFTTGSVDGQDGWDNELNDPEVSAAQDYNGSGKSLYLNGSQRAHKDLSSVADGEVYCAMYCDTSHTSGDGPGIQLRNGSGYIGAVKFAWAGGLVLQYLKSGGWTQLASGLSTDQWYVVSIDFDTSTEQVRYRYKEKDGSWSSYTSFATTYSNTSGVIQIRFPQDTTWQGYIDEIGDTDPDSGGGGETPANNAMAFGGGM